MAKLSHQSGFYGFEALGLITPLIFSLILGFSIFELGYLTSKMGPSIIGTAEFIADESKVLTLNQAAHISQISYSFDKLGFPVKPAGFINTPNGMQYWDGR